MEQIQKNKLEIIIDWFMVIFFIIISIIDLSRGHLTYGILGIIIAIGFLINAIISTTNPTYIE